MGCWLVKCFSFILYMLAWLGCQRWQASSERVIMPLCVLYVGYWIWWQEGAFHMASDRVEHSVWLMATRQWVLHAVPGANRWTQRYCGCIVAVWLREGGGGAKGTGHPLWTWSEPGVGLSSVTVLTVGGNSDRSLHSAMITTLMMMLENDPQRIGMSNYHTLFIVSPW